MIVLGYQMRLIIGLLFSLYLLSTQSCTMETEPISASNVEGDYVILLHGLQHSPLSMKRMEKSLSRFGYRVINHPYPARKQSIEQLAEENLHQLVTTCCDSSGTTVHFITHSFGSLILRYYLKRHKLPNLGRVVMLSPPNQGTELVDRYKDNPVFQLMNGPAGMQMGTDDESLPLQLGPVNYEVGVIAGTRSLNPLASRHLEGPDDGVVAVESTKVDGMADFLVTPFSHTFIMMSTDIIQQTIHFLQHGAFISSDIISPGSS
jgi:pimeloyl-ACP methyl ester carboxylesterase